MKMKTSNSLSFHGLTFSHCVCKHLTWLYEN